MRVDDLSLCLVVAFLPVSVYEQRPDAPGPHRGSASRLPWRQRLGPSNLKPRRPEPKIQKSTTRSEFRALASVSQEARVLLNKDPAMVGFFLRAPPSTLSPKLPKP